MDYKYLKPNDVFMHTPHHQRKERERWSVQLSLWNWRKMVMLSLILTLRNGGVMFRYRAKSHDHLVSGPRPSTDGHAVPEVHPILVLD